MKSEPPIVGPPGGSQPSGGSHATPPIVDARQESTRKKSIQDWIDKPWLVLLLLFGATAALGLPVLWKSQGFSRPAKIFWSVVVCLYTVLIFWLFFKVMAWSYSNIRDSLGN